MLLRSWSGWCSAGSIAHAYRIMRSAHGADAGRGKELSPLLLGLGSFPDQPGGVNRYVRNLHLALAERGFPVRTVTLGPSTVPSEGMTIAASASDPLFTRVLRYAAQVRLLAGDADIVDNHFALYALGPLLTKSLRGRPLVTHFHGPWAREHLGGAKSPTAHAKRLVERAVYTRSKELIVLSDAFRRILLEDYGVTPWHLHVVPPGVDVQAFNPGTPGEARRALELSTSSWIAFTARRLVPRMGIDVLLQAWQSFARGRDDVLLFVAGEGPEREPLEKRVDQLGIANSVRFTGRLTEDELVAHYQAADVCVVPSLALEGFGLVLLEALACGTPVIGTDVDGLGETLTRLEPDLVVPGGNPDALAERLASAHTARLPLPDAARCRSFAQSFSWGTVAEKHEQIYERAVRPKRRSRTRVVFVDHCARLSGGELALLRLLPELEQVDCHVILGEDGPLVRRLADQGISVEVLPMDDAARELHRNEVTPQRVSGRALLQASAYACRLARRLRRLRPDIVHTNSLKSALYGGAAGRLAGIPVVWHIRDRIAEDYLPAPAVRLVQTAARRLPSAIIANSKATLTTLGQTDVLQSVVSSPLVIYDSAATTPSQREDRRESLRIGMVGRLAPWKGQHVFLAGFMRAFGEGSETAVIVGAPLFGEDWYEVELRRRAVAFGLNGRVTFTGFREDIWAALDEIDILVHASITPEPFGQVIVEGMSVGLPVVATAAGGPTEIIEDGVDGLLYPPGDVDALAARLRTLAGDAGLRARLGRAAQDSSKRFAPEVVAAQVMEVYERVLAGR
jgi:glycosyltransferase involved in cell wall biosynthesis